MSFKSTVVTKKDDGYTVTGDFTLHGITKTIATTARFLGAGKDPWGGYRTGYGADFSVNRGDYGMKCDATGIADKVEISVAFEAVKKQVPAAVRPPTPSRNARAAIGKAWTARPRRG